MIGLILRCMMVAAILIPYSCLAANRYVRAGATGTGSGNDWINAYANLPSTLSRGDTYYIADGSYGAYKFNTPTSGTTVITIKKATAADHGTDVGWTSSYGDASANFTSLYFYTGYWNIDGQVGGGPTSWESGHGIKVFGSSGYKIRFDASNISNVSLSHVEAYNTDYTPGSSRFGAIIYAHAGNTHNVSFSHCFLHSVYGPILHFQSADYWTFEYCKMGNNTGDSFHSEIMSALGNDNLTLRYNWFYKWRSTGGLIAINGPEGGAGDANICDNWKIYGNVFHQDGTTAHWLIAAINDASNQQFARTWKIFNNTFIGVASTSTWVYGISLATTGSAANEFKNNVFYGNSVGIIIGGVEADHNSYQGSSQYFNGANDKLLTSSPFVNYSGKDYRLFTALPGVALGGEYEKDMFGNTRGADGSWDRGAFEFSIGVVTQSPTPPTNLTAVITSGN